MNDSRPADEITVLTLPDEIEPYGFPGDPLRGWSDAASRLRPTRIKVSELASSVKLFMQQMEQVLSETPTSLGDFEFSELEISAGVSASGQLTLLGVGGAEIGVEGSLKFVFRKRAPHP